MKRVLLKVQSIRENYETSLLLDANMEPGNKSQYKCRKIHHILDIDTAFEGYAEINNCLNNVLDWEMTYLDTESIPAFKPYDEVNTDDQQREVSTDTDSIKPSRYVPLKSAAIDQSGSAEYLWKAPNDDNCKTLENDNIDLAIPLPIALEQRNWPLVLLLLVRSRIYNDEHSYRQSLREVFFFTCLADSSHLALLFVHLPHLDITQPFKSEFLFRKYLVPLLSSIVSRTCPIPNELQYTHICCITKQHDVLQLILELKLGRSDDLDSNLQTPLHIACLSSSLDCVRLLIDSDANVNAHSILPDIPTPLYCAILSKSSPQLMMLLLQASANLEFKHSSFGTTLHLAATLGNVKLAEILIREGSDINSQVYVNWESIASLFKHKRLHRQSSSPRKSIKSSQEFLNQFDKRISTPLMIACALGNIQIVDLLLTNNADIHVQDCHQDTAIFYAAGEWSYGIVEKLILNGADVNSRNYLNDTPMLHALKAKQHQRSVKSCCQLSGDIKQLIRTIETLARNSADLNYENPQGDSFISLFLQHWITCSKLLELATKFDLDLDMPDQDGKTLLLHACEQGLSNIVRVLLIDVNTEVSDYDGNSPLLIACENGNNELIKLLLQVGADPFQENANGLSPFIVIVNRGNADVLDLILLPGYMRCEQLRTLKFLSIQPPPWVVAGKAGDDRVLSKLIKHLLWDDGIPFKEMFRQGLRESIYWWLLHPVYFVSCNPRQNTVTIKFSEMKKKYAGNKSLYHLITENTGLDLGSHPVVHAYVHSVFTSFAAKYLWVRIFLSILFTFALGYLFASDAHSRNKTGYNTSILPAELFVIAYWLSNITSEVLEFSQLLASGKKPNSYYWRKLLCKLGFTKRDYHDVIKAYKVKTNALKGRFEKLVNRRHFVLCAFLNYCKDGYNWVELVANLSLLMYFCIRIFLVIHPDFSHGDYLYYFRLITYLFNCSSFIKFIIILSLFGEYLHILFLIFKREVPKFLVLFLMTLFVFSVTFIIALRIPIYYDTNQTMNGSDTGEHINLFHLRELDGISDNFGYLLLFGIRTMIEGDQIDFNFYHNKFNYVAAIIYIGFAFLILIVYANLFIAQLSDAYQSVKENARSIVAENRMCFVYNNQARSIFSACFRPKNDFLILDGENIGKYFEQESALQVQELLFPSDKQEFTEVLETSLTELRTELKTTNYNQRPDEQKQQIEHLSQRVVNLTEELVECKQDIKELLGGFKQMREQIEPADKPLSN